MSCSGNQVFTTFERADKYVVDLFRGLPSSTINDEMNRLFCMHDYLQLLNPLHAQPLLGTAITVKTPIGDNLFFHLALDLAQKGDVIVVDGGSGTNRSLAGELMLRFAQEKGIAGVIVDGCLRDLEGIEHLTMPVYAKGITPQGPYKNGPGEINTPIACGGQVVFPGDILVGDRDGIVVVGKKEAEAIALAAQKKMALENEMFALMDSDFALYAEKHLARTQAWLEENSPVWHDGNN